MAPKEASDQSDAPDRAQLGRSNAKIKSRVPPAGAPNPLPA